MRHTLLALAVCSTLSSAAATAHAQEAPTASEAARGSARRARYAATLPSYGASNAMHVLAAVVGPLGLLIATGPAWASPCPPSTGWGPRICESSIVMNIVGLGVEALSIALGIAATVMHFEVRTQREALEHGDVAWGLAPWVGADGAGLAVGAWW